MSFDHIITLSPLFCKHENNPLPSFLKASLGCITVYNSLYWKDHKVNTKQKIKPQSQSQTSLYVNPSFVIQCKEFLAEQFTSLSPPTSSSSCLSYFTHFLLTFLGPRPATPKGNQQSAAIWTTQKTACSLPFIAFMSQTWAPMKSLVIAFA